MSSNIYLLSGPIQSGKTIRIINWVENKEQVDGIAAPVIDGKRYLKYLRTGEIKLLESGPNVSEERIICVGNYKFNKDVFEWAQLKLLNAYDQKPKWLIIDEIGILEFGKEGMI